MSDGLFHTLHTLYMPTDFCLHLLASPPPPQTHTQARAILEAAVNVAKEGVKPHPHIMIPLVGIEDELVGQAKIVKEVAEQVRDGGRGGQGLVL